MKRTILKRVMTVLMTIMLGIMMIAPATVLAAELPINFGDAESFAVLAGSTITNTGPTTIEGDVGLYPGTSITGFGSVTLVGGTLHQTDAIAMDAKADLLTAYNDAKARTSTGTIIADLGGTTLTPGVYTTTESIGLTGILTLDGQNLPNPVFIFKAGSTLTTISGSEIRLINGATASNVFWQVGSSATLGTNSIFAGNIMAQESVTLTTGAKIEGKVMALNGAVTLDSNVIGNIDYSMSIIKTADALTVEVGDTVNYTITVTNMGLETLTNISVTDTMIELNQTNLSLEFGESRIFLGSYVASVLGPLPNTARADSDQTDEVTSSVIVNVVADIVTPGPTTYRMSIVKTADATEVEVGDTINYTITVINTGIASLNGISVKDEMIGLDETITTLAVGNSSIFTGSYVALTPGVLTNTASASDDQASHVVDSVSTTVVAAVDVPVVPTYSMSIVKTTDADGVVVGDTVNYRIVVTNTGNATLNDIAVSDPMIGLNTNINALDSGESSIFTGSWIAQTAGLLTNTASASNSLANDVTDSVTVTVVAEIEEPLAPVEIDEVAVPIPDTSAESPILFYFTGALATYAGYIFLNRKKDLS